MVEFGTRDLWVDPHLTSPWEGEEPFCDLTTILPVPQIHSSPSKGEVRWGSLAALGCCP
jgi:hypothetical protein